MKSLNCFKTSAAALYLFFAITLPAWAAEPVYVVAGGGSNFTAAVGGAQIGAGDIQEAVNAIKADANGADCSIQFGDGMDTLVVDSNHIMLFDGGASGKEWGKITLLGGIRSFVEDSTRGIVTLVNGVSIESRIRISNGAFYGHVIYNASTGSVTVSGGRLWSYTYGNAIVNASTGTVTVSGGLIDVSGPSSILNRSSGTVNISGGTLQTRGSSGDRTVHNTSNGTVNISGGSVLSTNLNGIAVWSSGRGKVTISGNAVVKSGNTLTNRGTVYIDTGGSAADVPLEITDGIIENTANGRVVCNNSAGTVIISGGEMTCARCVGVIINNSSGTLTVDGGTVKAPDNQAVRNVSSGTVNIRGGTFTAAGYVIVNDSAGTVNISGGMITVPQTDADSLPIAVSVVLNNGSGTINISGGTITAAASYSGPYSGLLYNASTGTINISGGVVSSTQLEIWASYKLTPLGCALYNASTGAVNISGGTLSVVDSIGIAIYNNTAGKITVSGTAEITSENRRLIGGTIYMAERSTPANTDTSPRLEISGGTVVNNTTGRGNAVYNISPGAVNISGGTVYVNNGNAVYNDSTAGAVNISGGTVSVVNGAAVNNRSTGKITISGNAAVTSADTALAAVYVASRGTAAAARFEMSGGRLENTADGGTALWNASTGAAAIGGGIISASGRAVYNSGTGAVNISGGAVLAAMGNGAAVYNNSNGKVNVSGGVVRAAAGRAISSTSNNTVTVSGGIVFSYANAIKGAAGVINSGSFNNPSGTGMVVAWSNWGAGRSYKLLSSANIITLPAAAAAYWGPAAGSGAGIGIVYANGENTGVIELPVTVTEAEFTGANITIDGVAYTGKTVSPAVKCSNVELVKGEDYIMTVTSVDGVGTSAGINVGTVTVDIEGINSYEGTVTGKTFNIAPRPVAIIPASGQNKIPGGADPVFEYTANPALFAGDNFTGGLGREPGEAVGQYPFTLGDLSAGNNYTLALGGNVTFAIAQSVSVSSTGRVIPPQLNEEATVIAPMVILAGEFTAGPNPVSRSSGEVKFYRQGRRVSNSELRIYDATGNVISKVKISDNRTLNSQARRQVGSWDLTDKKGRQASEGTYLVKGVLKTPDGKSEKVSVILGIR